MGFFDWFKPKKKPVIARINPLPPANPDTNDFLKELEKRERAKQIKK